MSGVYRESMEGTPFGRYRLVGLLGRGGMGEVWRAYDSGTDRIVALKVLPSHFAQDPTFEQRFRREAHAAAQLHNPHVVPIHDFGELDGRLFVDMALIEGRDMTAVIADEPLTPSRAVAVIEHIGGALHAAHRTGVVHRDVKPSNILVDEDDYAYLIDFGIARAAADTGLTATGATIGTWAYMAPERFTSNTVDPRSDIYALACVLHECLTGGKPYPGNSLERQFAGHLTVPPPRPSELRRGVPTAFDDVVATGMAKDLERRYATTKQLAQAARDALSAGPGPERLEPPVTVTYPAATPLGVVESRTSADSAPGAVDSPPGSAHAQAAGQRDAAAFSVEGDIAAANGGWHATVRAPDAESVPARHNREAAQPAPPAREWQTHNPEPLGAKPDPVAARRESPPQAATTSAVPAVDPYQIRKAVEPERKTSTSRRRSRLVPVLASVGVLAVISGVVIALVLPDRQAKSGDTAPTYRLVATVPVGASPDGVAVDPATRTVYVTGGSDISGAGGMVSVVDGATNTVTATVSVGEAPSGVAVDPGARTIYVVNQASRTVSVIDGATNTVTATVPVGTFPLGLAVDPGTRTIYVADRGGAMSVIDGGTNTVTATVSAGENPQHVAVDTDTRTVYVTDASDIDKGTLSVIEQRQ